MSLLLGTLAPLLVASALPPQTLRRLSAPQAVTHPFDIVNAAIAPDGNRVVFVDTVPFGAIHSVSIDGGVPVRLNTPRDSREVLPVFLFDPTGRSVLYRARSLPNGSSLDDDPTFDLFAAPIDGSGPARVVSSAVDADYQCTPDGRYVLVRNRGFATDGANLAVIELGGTFSRTLDSRGILGVSAFRVHPGSAEVVYRSDRNPGTQQLFRLPVVGSSAPPVLLSGSPHGPVQPDFELLPDGSQVLYRADLELDGTLDLLAASVLTVSAPRKLSAGTLAGDVLSFRIAPNGARALYLGALETRGARELFSVPLDASAPPVRLNAPLVRGGAVLEPLQIDARARRVVHRVALAEEVFALDSAPLDGSAPATRLFGPLRRRDSVADDFTLTGNGRHVVFRADADGDRVFELYTVPSAGGTAVPLAPPDAAVSEFALLPGGVVFRAELDTPGVPELYGTRLDGTEPPVRVHPPLAFGHAVGRFAVRRDGRRAIYLADPTVRGVFELFQVSAEAGPAILRLSPDDLRRAAGEGVVQDFVVAGSRALYRGPQEAEDVLGLFSVPLDASAAPIALHPPQPSGGGVLTRALTPDGTRVVFVTGGEHRGRELHSAPVDGSAPTRRLDSPAHARSDVEPRFVLTPDGSEVLFVSDAERDETFELFRVPVDGSAAPLRLRRPHSPDRDVKPTFQISSDGTEVAFVSDAFIERIFELYSVLLDGSASERNLSINFSGGGDVRAVTLVEGSRTWALCLADLLRDEQFELFRMPLDGSSSQLRLSAPLVAEGDVSAYAVDPTGAWVVYLADQDRDQSNELYSVPFDASAAPRKLNQPLGQSGGVGSFRITPDGTRVVFLASGSTPYGASIAPIDGSAAPLDLSLGRAGFLPTWDYRITPDSRYLVFRVETLGPQRRFRPGLFSVPLDVSRPPAVLQVPSVLSPAFQLSPDATTVVYASHLEGTFRQALYRVPLDGPREASLELVGGLPGEVTQLEEHGGTLVFLSNGELYAW